MKFQKKNDNVLIQPTVKIVEKDRTVKIAHDARAKNKQLQKDDFKILNMEDLANWSLTNKMMDRFGYNRCT